MPAAAAIISCQPFLFFILRPRNDCTRFPPFSWRRPESHYNQSYIQFLLQNCRLVIAVVLHLSVKMIGIVNYRIPLLTNQCRKTVALHRN